MHSIYIVECRDGTYYTGYTNDIKKRIKAHNEGKGAKYTSGRRPVTLRYTEKYKTKSEALKREYAIKQLTRVEKQMLLDSGSKDEQAQIEPAKTKTKEGNP